MRTGGGAGLAVALLGIAASGCTGRIGAFYCPTEIIHASLPTALVAGEDASTAVLEGFLDAHVGESVALDAVQAAAEGQALGGGVAMWLGRGPDHAMSVSLWFPTPLRPGDVVPVVAAHEVGRSIPWGRITNPPAGLSVGLTLDEFQATAASGTARVLGVDPLRVDLDVMVSDGSRPIPLRGTLTVTHDTVADTCFE